MLHKLVCLISFPGMDTCLSGSVAEALRSSPVMALLFPATVAAFQVEAESACRDFGTV